MQNASNLPLPLQANFIENDYVESLLSFITSSDLFYKICGGVHILDFLTREPDLYSTVLPQAWREWFQLHEVSDILDLFLREDLAIIESRIACNRESPKEKYGSHPIWRDHPCPPLSLLKYVQAVRKRTLTRDFEAFNKGRNFSSSRSQSALPRHVAVGMKPKKIHEVGEFVKYIDGLITDIDKSSAQPITHIVDFGSGQNYLGRALASPPHNKSVVALESKELNIRGAKSMDITAKLARKAKVMRNKKRFRMGQQSDDMSQFPNGTSEAEDAPCSPLSQGRSSITTPKLEGENGNIQYIETCIQDGDLSHVIDQVRAANAPNINTRPSDPCLMVVSLHSCGNLVHHALRSIILNSSVKAVALIGCCYNLVTERLGQPTYKLPSLRSSNLRLDQTSAACDPHGFPMSERLATYRHRHGEGIRLNITSRMMACQAPQNWTATDCESFFTRHFYRALLQRIFLDKGIVEKPVDADDPARGSPRGWTGAGPALTIGSLRKACYTSFIPYVRGAIAKLAEDQDRGAEITKRMDGLTDEDIEQYEEKYKDRKRELSIVWSLMAFSASLVESTIVVDRWLWLKEQKEIKECWVEAVFDYRQSPRNLVVVGVKK